jgi:hypothetical protein
MTAAEFPNLGSDILGPGIVFRFTSCPSRAFQLAWTVNKESGRRNMLHSLLVLELGSDTGLLRWEAS